MNCRDTIRAMRCLALWLLLCGTAVAQTACDPSTTWTLEPSAKDTLTVEFTGRTLAGSPTPTIEIVLRKAKVADASPSAMKVGGPTVSGNTVSIQMYPDQGCAAVGCRKGNDYQIRFKPTDADANQPTGSNCFNVREEYLKPAGQ